MTPPTETPAPPRGWWGPSLMRRTLLALLAAMALVWLVLLGQAAITHYRAMDTNPGVRQLAQGLAGALATLDQPAEARALVHGMAHTLNAMRADVDLLQGTSVLLQLQDRTGQLLHSSTAGVRAVVLAGDAGHAAMDVAGTTHWVAWESTGPWRVVVAEPRLADARLLGFMGEDLAASVLLALPLVGLPLWLAVRTGLRPLARLDAQIAARSANDLRPLQHLPPQRELHGLAQSFDQLLARLRAHLAREKALVHDAAHELRTPMAVIATQAHVLAQAPEGPARAQASEALTRAVQRAAHLSEQLLTLAALEEAPAQHPTAPQDLMALLQDCLAERAGWAEGLGVELSLDGPDTLKLPLDRQLLWSALGNVLDNALKHGCGPGAGREVQLRVRQEGGDVVVWIADDGPGIAAGEQDRVFERFWRSPRARSSGSGLGLTIAQQAIGHLGGQVRLGPGLHGRGVGFTLRWPVAG